MSFLLSLWSRQGPRRALAVLASATLGATFWGACSSSATGETCTSGTYSTCLCDDGTEGTQLCTDGMHMGPCGSCGAASDGIDGGASKHQGGQDGNAGAGTDSGAGTDAGLIVPTASFCPGVAEALPEHGGLELHGTLTGTDSDFIGEADCASADGPDYVYAVTPATSGHVIATLSAKSFTPFLYTRADDCMQGRQIACGTAPAGTNSAIGFDVVGGKPFFLFADSTEASSGDFTLHVDLTSAPVCGDGHVDPGEACDDGNAMDGDGCDHACSPDGNVTAFGMCPGQPVHLWPSQVVRFLGQTTGFGSAFTASCDTTRAPARAFAVTAHKSGQMYVNVFAATFDVAVYALATCRQSLVADTTNELACQSAPSAPADGGSSSAMISFAVVDSFTYTVVVDGVDGASGNFSMELGIKN